MTVELPFSDGSQPATLKELTAIDATVNGQWTVEMAANPKQPTVFEELGIVTGPTWLDLDLGSQGESTHYKFKLTHSKAEYARLSNFAFHFDATDAG